MKIHATIALCLGLTATALMQAQNVTPLDPIKPINYYNPINPLVMCADPTAVEYDGRLYVYGTNDQQEYDYTQGTTNNSYGHIKTLVMMSTKDMTNWTYHGTIDMKEICGGWLNASWAPSIVSRVEDDGLTHFYMYFSNSGGGVGVITSTSPVGPWIAPLNHNLVSGSTPGLGPCTCPFDPGVVIDDNGVGWLALGGGDPNSTGTKLFPGNAKIVRLGDDMISLASEIVDVPAPYHFEANELNMIGGRYVYSYCTGWSDRNDWWKFSETAEAPSTCSICYMVSDNPLDPDSWEWGGDILKDPGAFGYPWGNNHSHLHKYDDKYYMIYHTQVMENLAGIGGGYRSIAINRAGVDEDLVQISPIKATNSGPAQIKENAINPFERQQAETFWNAVGVRTSAEKDPGNVSITNITPGGWTAIRNADFGDREATQITIRIRGNGRMEVRLNHVTSDPVAVIDFKGGTMHEETVALSKPVSGKQNIYFLFTSANGTTRWDEWQFSDGTEGISDISVSSPVVSEEYYTIEGKRADGSSPGLYILRSLHGDGTVSTTKIIK